MPRFIFSCRDHPFHPTRNLLGSFRRTTASPTSKREPNTSPLLPSDQQSVRRLRHAFSSPTHNTNYSPHSHGVLFAPRRLLIDMHFYVCHVCSLSSSSLSASCLFAAEAMPLSGLATCSL